MSAIALASPAHSFDQLCSDEAEMALLGAILLKPGLYDGVADALKPEDFASALHGLIFRAMGIIILQRATPDPITLKPIILDGALKLGLRDDKEVYAYLVRLASMTVSARKDDVKSYALVIAQYAGRRRLHQAGTALLERVFDEEWSKSPEEIAAAAEAEILEAVAAQSGDKDGHALPEVTAVVMERIEAARSVEGGITGISTGLTALDGKVAGLHRSDLIIIGARPAIGKTDLAVTLANAAARAQQRVLFFSLEMSAEQLVYRLMARYSGVTAENLRRGQVREFEMPLLQDAQQEINPLPIYIEDTADRTIEQIRSRARRYARVHPINLIVVDYVQLIVGTGRQENRVNELTAITRGLKAMAKDFDVPVVALAQLSRKVEEREDKRPMLSDLRESGSIEQDADSVWFLFREEYYLSREEPMQRTNESAAKFIDRQADWSAAMARARGRGDIIIAKNRHGSEGTVHCRFDGARSVWED